MPSVLIENRDFEAKEYGGQGHPGTPPGCANWAGGFLATLAGPLSGGMGGKKFARPNFEKIRLESLHGWRRTTNGFFDLIGPNKCPIGLLSPDEDRFLKSDVIDSKGVLASKMEVARRVD